MHERRFELAGRLVEKLFEVVFVCCGGGRLFFVLAGELFGTAPQPNKIAVADAPALQRELLEAGFITNAPNAETLRLAPSYLISDEQRAAFTSALRAALARRRR